MSEQTPPSAVPPEEAMAQLEEHNRELQQQIDALQQQVAAQEVQIQTQQEIAAQQAATIERLHATLTQEKPVLHPNLPENQREVLQAILDLPKGDNVFAEAEKLMEPLVGQPMTESFANSLKEVLRMKGWGVVCEVCLLPSSYTWLKGDGYAQGGRGFFSHTGKSTHKLSTVIRKFIFTKKLDRRHRVS